MADANLGKDLLDMTLLPDTNIFDKNWSSGSGNSRFIKVNSEVFTKATSTRYLETEWNNQSSFAEKDISNIKNGDCYLVKTFQTGLKYDVYVILVTDIVETMSDNMDYIEFSYKGG